MLLGVLYIYILRARQFARMKARGSRRSVSSRNKKRRGGGSGLFSFFDSKASTHPIFLLKGELLLIFDIISIGRAPPPPPPPEGVFPPPGEP